MQPRRFTIAFYGSSLVSAYWNGAATYYRGIISALHRRGHRVVFFEPDAYERQAHRDIPDPPYARSVVYPARDEREVLAAVEQGGEADIVVKTSGVGVFDGLLEEAVLRLQSRGRRVVYWDVDAPVTLDRMRADPTDPFRPLVPQYDLVLTYGGGDPVVAAYREFGARGCIPIYNALDPEEHFPVPPDPRFTARLGFMGNRMPDREERVREFFFGAAERMADSRFLLGGNGWEPDRVPRNVRCLGHVYTRDHNAFNSTPTAVLNINRESMARYGHSPPTRVFEAAGAAACLIIDGWDGIEAFLEPGTECLTARSGREVAEVLEGLDPERARRVGRAAHARVIAEHTYAQRAARVEAALLGIL